MTERNDSLGGWEGPCWRWVAAGMCWDCLVTLITLSLPQPLYRTYYTHVINAETSVLDTVIGGTTTASFGVGELEAVAGGKEAVLQV